MTSAPEALAAGVQEILGRPATVYEVESFQKYLDLLVRWQRSQRLVGSVDPVWIVEHLFLDSLLFLRALSHPVSTLLDLGSGAGVPGVPIKIVRPDIAVTLLESRRRRASFLSTVVRELGLQGVHVVNARLDEVVDDLEGDFDAVVMRCAGDPATLIPEAMRLLRPGGAVVVSGPPKTSALAVGEWVTVPGPRSGSSRRFVVARRS